MADLVYYGTRCSPAALLPRAALLDSFVWRWVLGRKVPQCGRRCGHGFTEHKADEYGCHAQSNLDSCIAIGVAPDLGPLQPGGAHVHPARILADGRNRGVGVLG